MENEIWCKHDVYKLIKDKGYISIDELIQMTGCTRFQILNFCNMLAKDYIYKQHFYIKRHSETRMAKIIGYGVKK